MVRLSIEGKAALDKLVARATADPRLPSFVFGAATADGEIYFKGGGFTVKDDPSSGEVCPDTVFRICSQTKTVTSIAALHLIEKGGLAESDPVSKYLPEFLNTVVLVDPLADEPTYVPAKTTMTVKHLLNFSSGLATPVKVRDPMRLAANYLAPHDEKDPIGGFLKVLKGTYPGIPLVHEPGADFSYGWSADVLGFVIEKASGQRLEEYFKEHIFDPLGIRASFYLDGNLKERLVRIVKKDPTTGLLVYTNEVDEEGFFNIDPSKVFCYLGGVGLYTSARDYLALLRHLLEIHNETASNPIISAATLKDGFSPGLTKQGEKTLAMVSHFDPFSPHHPGFWQWCKIFSVVTEDWPERRRKGSGSWGGWANTYHFIDPTTGVAAVFETNMLPTLHRDVLEYFGEFEKTLYAGLV